MEKNRVLCDKNNSCIMRGRHNGNMAQSATVTTRRHDANAATVHVWIITLGRNPHRPSKGFWRPIRHSVKNERKSNIKETPLSQGLLEWPKIPKTCQREDGRFSEQPKRSREGHCRISRHTLERCHSVKWGEGICLVTSHTGF